MSKPLWLINVDTRHYNFMVIAESREAAIREFKAGWDEHRKQTGAVRFQEFFPTMDDLGPRRIATDTFYRDYDILHRSKK